MSPEKFNDILEKYRNQLQGILSRFTQSPDGIHINQQDDQVYRI